MPLVPPVTAKLPASAFTLTNCADPKSVLVIASCPPLTTALTPVDDLFETIAAAICVAVVPLAKLSCCVPAFPAISRVTAAPKAVPALVNTPVVALVTT